MDPASIADLRRDIGIIGEAFNVRTVTGIKPKYMTLNPAAVKKGFADGAETEVSSSGGVHRLEASAGREDWERGEEEGCAPESDCATAHRRRQSQLVVSALAEAASPAVLPLPIFRKFDSEQSELHYRRKARPRIVICDDNMLHAAASKIIFEQYFEHVFMAANGKQVLELLEHTVIDAVFVDAEMPVMDAAEACAVIRHTEAAVARRAFRVLVVAMVTREQCADAALMDELFLSGVDRYVVKPLIHHVHAAVRLLSTGQGGRAEAFRRLALEKGWCGHYSEIHSALSAPQHVVDAVDDAAFAQDSEERGQGSVLLQLAHEPEDKANVRALLARQRAEDMERMQLTASHMRETISDLTHKIEALEFANAKMTENRNADALLSLEAKNRELEKHMDSAAEKMSALQQKNARLETDIKNLIDNGSANEKLVMAAERRSNRAHLKLQLTEQRMMEMEDRSAQLTWHNYYGAAVATDAFPVKKLPAIATDVSTSWFKEQLAHILSSVASQTAACTRAAATAKDYIISRAHQPSATLEMIRRDLIETFSSVSSEINHSTAALRLTAEGAVADLILRELAFWKTIHTGSSEAVELLGSAVGDLVAAQQVALQRRAHVAVQTDGLEVLLGDDAAFATLLASEEEISGPGAASSEHGDADLFLTALEQKHDSSAAAASKRPRPLHEMREAASRSPVLRALLTGPLYNLADSDAFLPREARLRVFSYAFQAIEDAEFETKDMLARASRELNEELAHQCQVVNAAMRGSDAKGEALQEQSATAAAGVELQKPLRMSAAVTFDAIAESLFNTSDCLALLFDLVGQAALATATTASAAAPEGGVGRHGSSSPNSTSLQHGSVGGAVALPRHHSSRRSSAVSAVSARGPISTATSGDDAEDGRGARGGGPRRKLRAPGGRHGPAVDTARASHARLQRRLTERREHHSKTKSGGGLRAARSDVSLTSTAHSDGGGRGARTRAGRGLGAGEGKRRSDVAKAPEAPLREADAQPLRRTALQRPVVPVANLDANATRAATKIVRDARRGLADGDVMTASDLAARLALTALVESTLAARRDSQHKEDKAVAAVHSGEMADESDKRQRGDCPRPKVTLPSNAFRNEAQTLLHVADTYKTTTQAIRAANPSGALPPRDDEDIRDWIRATAAASAAASSGGDELADTTDGAAGATPLVPEGIDLAIFAPSASDSKRAERKRRESALDVPGICIPISAAMADAALQANAKDARDARRTTRAGRTSTTAAAATSQRRTSTGGSCSHSSVLSDVTANAALLHAIEQQVQYVHQLEEADSAQQGEAGSIDVFLPSVGRRGKDERSPLDKPLDDVGQIPHRSVSDHSIGLPLLLPSVLNDFVDDGDNVATAGSSRRHGGSGSGSARSENAADAIITAATTSSSGQPLGPTNSHPAAATTTVLVAHRVAIGESLSSIAAAYGVSLEALLAANAGLSEVDAQQPLTTADSAVPGGLDTASRLILAAPAAASPTQPALAEQLTRDRNEQQRQEEQEEEDADLSLPVAAPLSSGGSGGTTPSHPAEARSDVGVQAEPWMMLVASRILSEASEPTAATRGATPPPSRVGRRQLSIPMRLDDVLRSNAADIRGFEADRRLQQPQKTQRRGSGATCNSPADFSKSQSCDGGSPHVEEGRPEPPPAAAAAALGDPALLRRQALATQVSEAMRQRRAVISVSHTVASDEVRVLSAAQLAEAYGVPLADVMRHNGPQSPNPVFDSSGAISSAVAARAAAAGATSVPAARVRLPLKLAEIAKRVEDEKEDVHLRIEDLLVASAVADLMGDRQTAERHQRDLAAARRELTRLRINGTTLALVASSAPTASRGISPERQCRSDDDETSGFSLASKPKSAHHHNRSNNAATISVLSALPLPLGAPGAVRTHATTPSISRGASPATAPLDPVVGQRLGVAARDVSMMPALQLQSLNDIAEVCSQIGSSPASRRVSGAQAAVVMPTAATALPKAHSGSSSVAAQAAGLQQQQQKPQPAGSLRTAGKGGQLPSLILRSWAQSTTAAAAATAGGGGGTGAGGLFVGGVNLHPRVGPSDALTPRRGELESHRSAAGAPQQTAGGADDAPVARGAAPLWVKGGPSTVLAQHPRRQRRSDTQISPITASPLSPRGPAAAPRPPPGDAFSLAGARPSQRNAPPLPRLGQTPGSSLAPHPPQPASARTVRDMEASLRREEVRIAQRVEEYLHRADQGGPSPQPSPPPPLEHYSRSLAAPPPVDWKRRRMQQEQQARRAIEEKRAKHHALSWDSYELKR